MADSQSPRQGQGKKQKKKGKKGDGAQGEPPVTPGTPQTNDAKAEKKDSPKEVTESPKGEGQKVQEQKGQKVNQGSEGQGQADGAPVKSKAQLKAERRAIQEAQRAAKEATKTGMVQQAGKQGPSGKQGPAGGSGAVTPVAMSKQGGGIKQTSDSRRQEGMRVPDNMQMDQKQAQKRISKKLERQQVPSRATTQRKVGLFSHLPQYEKDVSLTQNIKLGSSSSNLHPSIVKLGLQYADGVISGSNARCIAFLAAMKQVIKDYSTPLDKELSRDLDNTIKPYISFLEQCRPPSVSMRNAVRHLKWLITHIPQDMPENKAKEHLIESIENFYREKIVVAGKAISEFALNKIEASDVILVYGGSSLIARVLCDAHDAKTKFSVIVVDGRPRMEGVGMLKRLVNYGIKCSYVLINAASYVMQEVTKVFLGAHALLANGYVMSRVGTAQVALIAKSYNVPVLVCCETYKFSDRVQTDSFVFNEVGDPNDIVPSNSGLDSAILNWREVPSLKLLHLVYDVMPPELVTMVITDLGVLPCTSVPVVLRVKQVETEEKGV